MPAVETAAEPMGDRDIPDAPAMAEAGIPDASTAPAPDAARGCTWGPFSAPMRLPVVSSANNEWSPSLTGDGLELFFGSQRGGGAGLEDIYVASRSTPEATFRTPVNLAAINSASHDRGPVISADGRELFFFSDRPGGLGGRDMWTSTRTSSTSPFTTPRRVVGLNTGSEEIDAWLSSDGNRIYFTSSRTGAVRLYMASRQDGQSPFGPPALVSGVDPGIEHPTLSSDEQELIFAADRAGAPGGIEIWLARRTGRGAAFSSPINLSVLNTPENEHDPTLSRDGATLYYVRGFVLGGTDAEIWVATRSCTP